MEHKTLYFLGSVLHTVLSLVTVPPLLCTEGSGGWVLYRFSHTLCTALPQYPITTLFSPTVINGLISNHSSLFHNQNQQDF